MQEVRGGDVGARTLPQNQALPLHTADTTGLPAEGVLARVAIGDLAGVGGGAMTTASMPGFPARGSSYYVFSLGQNIPAAPAPSQGGESGAPKKEGGKP